MTWPALPTAEPWSPVERRGVRRIDAEFYGKTVVDQLLARGAVVLGGGLDMDGSAISGVGSVDFQNNGSNPTESDGPDQYPDGWSYNLLSASSWPISTGWVETFSNIGHNRAYQIIRNQTSANAPMQFHRYYLTDATWSDWHIAYPCHGGGDSSTAYNIVAANTWETAYTFTETAYPSSSFTARIHAQARCWMNDQTSVSRLRMRVGISRDGGSTFSYGVPSIADQSGTNDIHPQVSYERTRGSVTGNIVVIIEVQSDNATSYADDFAVDVTISEPT